MSIDRRPPKDQRRDAAREKARAMREAAARKHRRNRVLALSAGVVAVLVVAALVAVAITRSNQPVAAPPGISSDGGIVTGQADAAHTVAIYQDYQCPNCKQFDDAVGPWLEQQRSAGVTKIEYRPISILDRLSGGTRYSTRSASAAACMAQQPVDVFTAWNDAMYAQQPEEGGTGLPSARVAELATQAGAPAAVADCIRDDRYADWAATATRASADKGVTGTPTVFVDGEQVQSSQAAIAQALGVAS